MKKLALFSGAIFLVVLSALGQGKLYSVKDITSNYDLYPEYYRIIHEMAQLQWVEGDDAYTYTKSNVLYNGKLKGKDKELMNIEDLNKILEKSGMETVKRFPRVNWIDPLNFYYITRQGQIILLDMKGKTAIVKNCCHATSENSDIDENTFSVAYTSGNNLYIATGSGDSLAVTSESDKGIVSGQYVSRREFGIEKGTFWSPKGTYLAFYQKDESKVSDYPIINIYARVATNEAVKYPMAGMTSEKVSVGIFNPKSRETVWLKTGKPIDQYLTNITWGPHEEFIYIAVLNREQNHMKLNKYNVATGELVKTLFEEKNKKYVEPMTGMYFFKTNPNEFLWLSERSGFKHIYQYNTDGEMINKVTDGQFDVLEFVGFDATEKNVIYLAVDEEYPLQHHIYSTNLETMEVVKLSTADGTHSAELSSNRNYLLDFYSSSKIAHEIALIDINGMPIKKVYNNYDPTSEYSLGEISVGAVNAKDGTPLYYRLIKPVDFDPSKKYPVLVYLYGGPHAQMITNSWRYGVNPFLEYFAQHGYVVFTLDNRGSDNRGLKFEQAVFDHLGTVETSDQMKGIEYLKSKPFVDPDKIGIHGWSFGGFMTTALMLREPETFKVGIAGAPVIDWSMYEVMYGERYMDTPEENPDGYKNSNLLNDVDQLQGKLMLIHGTSDETVVWQHTLKFLDACINKGVQVDYFVYPGQKHGVRGLGRTHLNQKMINYFDEYLKGK